MEKLKKSWFWQTYVGRHICGLVMLCGVNVLAALVVGIIAVLESSWLSFDDFGTFMLGVNVILYMGIIKWAAKAKKQLCTIRQFLIQLAWTVGLSVVLFAMAPLYKFIVLDAMVRQFYSVLSVLPNTGIYFALSAISLIFGATKIENNKFMQWRFGHAIAAFCVLWVWYLMSAVYGGIFVDEDLGIFLIGFGNYAAILGVLLYLVLFWWVCKALVKSQPTVKSVHWLDLYIGRVIWTIGFVIVACIATLAIAVFAGSNIINSIYEINIPSVSVMIFSTLCTLSLLFGWFLAGHFIKQSLITEANVKADEIFQGKKRAKDY